MLVWPSRYVIGVLAVLLALLLLYAFYLRHENATLFRENIVLKQEIAQCESVNSKLTESIKLNHEKYTRKINDLLKLANKPPKVIRIPKIIYKKVKVTPYQCKQMCIMIDEFFKDNQ